MNFNDLWNNVKQQVHKKSGMSDASYNLWIKELILFRLTESTAYVLTPNNLSINILTNKYKPIVEKALSEALEFDVYVIFISTENTSRPIEDIVEDHIANGKMPKGALSSEKVLHPYLDMPDYIPPEEIAKNERLNPYLRENSQQEIKEPEKSTLTRSENGMFTEGVSSSKPEEGFPTPVLGNMTYNEQYTFENFVVGSTNKFAHAACIGITNNPYNLYNPLFIYGASGLGKTHLLHAMTNRLLESGKAKNVLYVRGEDFTNQMISTLAQNKPLTFFREKYRKVDVLLVDDIQFIAGKEAIQEEFFHTFNALYDDHKQIILASDRPPKDMQNLEDRLKSRFEWGLIVDIQPPDLELRVAILKNKSDSMGIYVPDEVLIYLAEEIKSNIRQLEGAIRKLNAYCFLNNSPINMDFAKKCILDIKSDTEPISVTVDKIFGTVSAAYSVSIEEIKSKKRTKEISDARHAAIYLLRKLTDMSLNDIGKIFGQHHTTILSAINNMEDEIKNVPSTEQMISSLIKNIK